MKNIYLIAVFPKYPTIFFDPIGKSELRPSGAAIKDGKYSVEEKHGPHIGKYAIRFSAKRATGEMQIAEDDQDEEEVFEEYLPAKFTSDTGIEVEFKAGEENVFDYDIKT